MASILVVDDDSTIRELASLWLTMDGHRVITAGTAAEAFAATLSHKFDLVLTDVHMPQDSGQDLLRYVEKYRPGIRVLLMSGDPDTASPRHEFLAKPFTQDELTQTVGRGAALHQALNR